MSRSDENSRIEQEASDWVIQNDCGLSPEQQDEFHDWLAADPRHKKAYEEFGQTWSDLDLVQKRRPEDTTAPDPDLLAQRDTGLNGFRFVGWATLGVLLVSLLSWSKLRKEAEPLPIDNPISDVEAEYVRLPDGSEIDLREGASYTVNYSSKTREITLQKGEAFFSVMKEFGRPFIVMTPTARLKAVGTEFNVAVSEEQLSVLVSEGEVEVEHRVISSAEGKSPSLAKISLAAGRMLTGEPKTASENWILKSFNETDVNQLLAWKPVVLNFDSNPLQEAVEAFNRHNETKVTIDGDTLRNMPVTARFRSNNVEGFVRLLEATDSVRAERSPGRILLKNR